MADDFEIIEGTLRKYTGDEAVVTIPEGVVKIGRNAFQNNEILREVILPDTVIAIRRGAFRCCENLEKVTSGGTVMEIGEFAFEGCPKFNIQMFSSTRPIVSKKREKPEFEIIGSTLKRYNGTAATVILPETVSRIGIRAFGENDTVREVHLPASVTEIREYAFWNCSALEKVTFSYPLPRLDGVIFVGCPKLRVEEYFDIRHNTLHKYIGMQSVVTIPPTVNTIGGMAFRFSSMEKVIIPASVEGIESQAFWGCYKLRTVEMEEGICGIGIKAFVDCSGLNKINLPESLICIYANSFWRCGRFEINVSKRWKKEHQQLCMDMLQFNQPELLFRKGCEVGGWRWTSRGVEKMKLSDLCCKIAADAFCDSTDLQEIIIPESVERIPASAFRGCINLRKISFKDSASYIAGEFENCPNLDLHENFEIIENTLRRYEGYGKEVLVIPDTVKVIGRRAFDCQYMRKIIVPSSVQSIRRSAFVRCEQLEEVQIEEGNRNIGRFAFRKCKNLKKVYFPDSLGKIDESIFEGCDYVEIVASDKWKEQNRVLYLNMERRNPCFKIVDDTFVWYSGENEVKLWIPYGCQKIEKKSFWYGNSLEHIYLPDTIEEIAECAFAGCINLTEITIPAPVKEISGSAFEDCINLRRLVIEGDVHIHGKLELHPDVQIEASEDWKKENYHVHKSLNKYGPYGIENGTLTYCNPEEEVVEISECVRKISKDAFAGCTSLKRLMLSVHQDMDAPEGCLHDCVTLEEVELVCCGFGMEWWIPKGFFAGCKKLKKIVYLTDVWEWHIGDRAFYGCESLEEIILPNKTKTIGKDVFAGCVNLRSITVPDTVEKVGDVFSIAYPRVQIVASEKWKAQRWQERVLLEEGKRLVIPEGVTEIDGGDVEGVGVVTEMVIPDSVEAISPALFGIRSYNWRTIKVIASDAWKEKHWDLVAWLDSREKLIVPASTESIQELVPGRNLVTKEVYISEGVKEIGPWAFWQFEKLEEIIIPDSVQIVGVGAMPSNHDLHIIASESWKRKHWRCHPSLKQYAPWWQKLFCRQ